MDLLSISNLSNINGISSTPSLSVSALSELLPDKANKTEGTMFDSILNTAMDNLKTTNSYLSDAENEEIKFALGETENTHDLTIALQKASTALQYTVAIRDKLMDSYRELMQMQI